MQILKPNTKPQRNNAHFQMQTELMNMLVTAKANTLVIKPQFEKWRESYMKEDEALKKIRKSFLTDDIKEVDGKRNRVFSGTTSAVASALNHFNADTAAAARRIQIVFDTYGSVTRKSVDEKTSAIYNLVKELNENYESDVETVGLGEWLKELQRLNDELSRLVSRRYEESAGRTTLVVKEVRAEVDENFRVLCTCIEAVWVMAVNWDDKALYADMIRKINAIIEHYNNLAARKTSGSDTAKGGDTGDNGTDTPDTPANTAPDADNEPDSE